MVAWLGQLTDGLVGVATALVAEGRGKRTMDSIRYTGARRAKKKEQQSEGPLWFLKPRRRMAGPDLSG